MAEDSIAPEVLKERTRTPEGDSGNYRRETEAEVLDWVKKGFKLDLAKALRSNDHFKLAEHSAQISWALDFFSGSEGQDKWLLQAK